MPLIDDIRISLKGRPVKFEALLELIAKAPAQERRVAGAGLRSEIYQCDGLIPGQPAALLTALLEGDFDWSGKAVTGKGEYYSSNLMSFLTNEVEHDFLDSTANLMCWEAIFYAAYLANIAPKIQLAEWLKYFTDIAFCREIGTQKVLRYQNEFYLWASLGYKNDLPDYDAENPPLPGILVFYANPKQSNKEVFHVALSVGGGYAMSCPGITGNTMQKIHIAEYPDAKKDGNKAQIGGSIRLFLTQVVADRAQEVREQFQQRKA